MTDYYVDGAVGNDANAGTSEGSGNAWATIQHAENNTAAGDIIYIKNSVTYSESITLAVNASGNLCLQWIGYETTPGDDGVVTIDATGNNYVLYDNAAAKDRRVFYNIRFTGATLDGLQMDASDYLFMYNCEVDNNGGEGATAYYGGEFLNCSFHDNGGNGLFAHRLGKLSHSCFYNNGECGFAGGDAVIQRCIFYENGTTYPEVRQDALSPDAGVQYYHNVFYKSTQSANLVEWLEITMVALVNNIFVGGLIAFEDIVTDTYRGGVLYSESNCFYNQATQPLNERFTDHGVVYNSVEADPEFTDPASGDFTLQATSPCIGAGQDVYGYSNRTIGAYPESGVIDGGALVAQDSSFMDGTFTEEEWWGRRRSLYRTNNDRGQQRTTARPERS